MIYDVINIMTSSLCILQTRSFEFYRRICKLHARWRHGVDDVTDHVLVKTYYWSKFHTISGTLDIKVCILAILVCEIHKSHMTKKHYTIFRSIFEGYYWCKFRVVGYTPKKQTHTSLIATETPRRVYGTQDLALCIKINTLLYWRSSFV